MSIRYNVVSPVVVGPEQISDVDVNQVGGQVGLRHGGGDRPGPGAGRLQEGTVHLSWLRRGAVVLGRIRRQPGDWRFWIKQDSGRIVLGRHRARRHSRSQ